MTRRKWIALVVLVAIGIGLLVAVVAVPWGDDAPDGEGRARVPPGRLDRRHGRRGVRGRAPATPSTGYTWTAAGNPDVTFVSTRQVAGGSQPGAAGTQELTFTGRQAGESKLVFTYARSTEKADPPAKTAKLPLTVTK